MNPINNVTILGAGNWGTAIAKLLGNNQVSVTLWTREEDVCESILHRHENVRYLPNVSLPPTVSATSDLSTALRDADAVVLTIPTQALRAVLTEALSAGLSSTALIINAAKGIEINSGMLISQLLTDILPTGTMDRVAYLSGPTFANEVAREFPTTALVASTNSTTATTVQRLLRTPYFLTYTSDDVVGVEVGGAVKNVMAIACGMSDGLGFGHNTRAALITRGLYEMIKIGVKLGANPLTFSGLAGVGDLVLTCTGDLSRNRTVGYRMGQGESLDVITQSMTMVAEGVPTTKAVYQLVTKLGITAPITTEMYHILYENKSPRQAVDDLTQLELHGELRNIRPSHS